MKIAIFGGSFNPLHIGHANVAETLVKEHNFDKVIFVPTLIPPHKNFSNDVSAKMRFEMLKDFCAGEKNFEASDCEIVRGGVSYTIDTVNFFLEKYKNELTEKPALVMGIEQATEFEKWKSADEIAQLTNIFIARRKKESEKTDSKFQNTNTGAYRGDLYESEKPFAFPHTIMENEMIALSSTNIRERIAQKKSWRYLVPERVFKYIVKNKLYEL